MVHEALSCSACNALTHAAALKDLAVVAEQQLADQDYAGARATWSHMLSLLPPTSQQYALIRGKITALPPASLPAATAPASVTASRKPTEPEKPWWKRGLAGIATAILFLLSKLKFLLLGLSKLSTIVSMFAFFAVYWYAFGWPLAAGFVLSIYIHEMGHVAALRRLGIAASAPMFIPGVGALIRLKQRISNPADDAFVGLAGPLWGLGAAVTAYVIYVITHAPVWAAVAQLGGYLNLFNLIPVWQLDGSRGFHAFARWQRLFAIAVIGIAYLLTGQKILLVIGAVAIYRAFQRNIVLRADTRALATYVFLIATLSLLAEIRVFPAQ